LLGVRSWTDEEESAMTVTGSTVHPTELVDMVLVDRNNSSNFGK